MLVGISLCVCQQEAEDQLVPSPPPPTARGGGGGVGGATEDRLVPSPPPPSPTHGDAAGAGAGAGGVVPSTSMASSTSSTSTLELDSSKLMIQLQSNARASPLSEEELFSLMLPVLPAGPDPGVLPREQPITVSQPALAQLLLLLKQVDAELERVAGLWEKIEVAFDVMLLKGEHLDLFLDFAKNPQVMERFKARMKEYQYFWSQMQRMAAANTRVAPVEGAPPPSDMAVSAQVYDVDDGSVDAVPAVPTPDKPVPLRNEHTRLRLGAP